MRTVIDTMMGKLEAIEKTVPDLARYIDLPPGNVWNWIRRGNIPTEKLVIVSEFLGCTTDELLGANKKQILIAENKADYENNVPPGWNRLGDDAKKVITDLIILLIKSDPGVAGITKTTLHAPLKKGKSRHG